jgi:hypothetical protein
MSLIAKNPVLNQNISDIIFSHTQTLICTD